MGMLPKVKPSNIGGCGKRGHDRMCCCDEKNDMHRTGVFAKGCIRLNTRRPEGAKADLLFRFELAKSLLREVEYMVRLAKKARTELQMDNIVEDMRLLAEDWVDEKVNTYEDVLDTMQIDKRPSMMKSPGGCKGAKRVTIARKLAQLKKGGKGKGR